MTYFVLNVDPSTLLKQYLDDFHPALRSSEEKGCIAVLYNQKNQIKYQFMSCHIISYHTISYHIISYYIISYHIILYHIILYHIISYQFMSCHVISYHITSCHITLYHIILDHIISFKIIRYYKIMTYWIQWNNHTSESSMHNELHLLRISRFIAHLVQMSIGPSIFQLYLKFF